MGRKAQLRALAAQDFERSRFIVVSNREPFSHERQDGRVVCARPAGGLTSALHPILGAFDDGVWVAHGSGTADRDVVDGNDRVMVPSGDSAYTLRRVWIPEELARGHYSGLANRGLWPLCHNVYQRPRFSAAEWECYREANAIFAEAVLEEAAGEPGVVFIQDYHLGLVPRMLKNENPDLTVAHFWHIPWPAAEIFDTFPWKEELIDGMLGSDLVGFQVRQYSSNFLDTVGRASKARVDRERGRVVDGNSVTSVSDFPIGIDFDAHCELAESEGVRVLMQDWTDRMRPGVKIGIGIDRIDYTKGILERVKGIDAFLRRYPEWREKLVFVQVGVPSRCNIQEYRALRNAIEEEIAAVNRRWRTAAWQPIQFIQRNLRPEEMMALHRIASFCLVTSLHDGMNLVAKEFVASRSDLDGVLVLSRFAGACRELTSAVPVNPFYEDDIAEGILTALSLSPLERRRRMARMRSAVQENDIYQWATDILSALARAGSARVGGRPPVSHRPAAAVRVAQASYA